jgi:hypothetical protein
LLRSLSGFYAKATGQDASSTGLGALRTFRLLRVFKLARSWKDLQKLLLMIMQSVMDVTNAVALLGIIMFIFTLLGMQLPCIGMRPTRPDLAPRLSPGLYFTPSLSPGTRPLPAHMHAHLIEGGGGAQNSTGRKGYG